MPQTVLMSDRPSASRAGDLLLLSVAAGSFWTLSYQFVLILRWPAKTIIWCFLLIAIAGFLLLGRLWKKTNAIPGRGYRFHLSQVLLVALGLLCAITVLFVRRPNQDDVVYFHRVLAQLSALGQPIFLRQTSVDMDAAAFSPVHLATSHERLGGVEQPRVSCRGLGERRGGAIRQRPCYQRVDRPRPVWRRGEPGEDLGRPGREVALVQRRQCVPGREDPIVPLPRPLEIHLPAEQHRGVEIAAVGEQHDLLGAGPA